MGVSTAVQLRFIVISIQYLNENSRRSSKLYFVIRVLDERSEHAQDDAFTSEQLWVMHGIK
jgi:hypothetical protein